MIELCYEYLLSCVFVYELSSCGLESSCSHLRNICLTKLLPTMTSTSITLCIWEPMSLRMTWPYHRRQLWIIISPIFKARPTLSWRTSVDTLSISLTLHIILSYNVPPHATSPHPQQEVPRFYSSTTKLVYHNPSPVASKINSTFRLTHHLTPWTSFTHYQFLHSLPQMLDHNK